MPQTPVWLSAREYATVLAALDHYRTTTRADRRGDPFGPTGEYFETQTPMDDDELETLQIRIRHAQTD